MDFSLKGKEEIVTGGELNDGFVYKMMEDFGFECFVEVEIFVGNVLV